MSIQKVSIFNILNIEKYIYILGYTYRYIKGYIGRSNREIECILKGGKGRREEGEGS